MGLSLTEFRQSRRRKRLTGAGMFWGGLVLLAIDMNTDFPTPVHGKYAAWWLIVVAVGVGLWIAAKRLPLEEAIEVAKYCRGELNVPDLAQELYVTFDTAERILAALVRKGRARVEQRGEARTWVLPDVKAWLLERQRMARR